MLPLALFMYFLAYLLCINAVNSDHGGVTLQRTCSTCIMQFKGFAVLSVRYDKINILSFSGIRNVVLAQA